METKLRTDRRQTYEHTNVQCETIIPRHWQGIKMGEIVYFKSLHKENNSEIPAYYIYRRLYISRFLIALGQSNCAK